MPFLSRSASICFIVSLVWSVGASNSYAASAVIPKVSENSPSTTPQTSSQESETAPDKFRFQFGMGLTLNALQESVLTGHVGADFGWSGGPGLYLPVEADFLFRFHPHVTGEISFAGFGSSVSNTFSSGQPKPGYVAGEFSSLIGAKFYLFAPQDSKRVFISPYAAVDGHIGVGTGPQTANQDGIIYTALSNLSPFTLVGIQAGLGVEVRPTLHWAISLDVRYLARWIVAPIAINGTTLTFNTVRIGMGAAYYF